ncbi:hypothetical protein OG21DRAFT_1607539 [Imleria badia]|nr:hypothetical protein OG21DRAFT_1607539 [Imleria badia]
MRRRRPASSHSKRPVENKEGPTAGDAVGIKGMPYCWTHLIPDINTRRERYPFPSRQSMIAYNGRSTKTNRKKHKDPPFSPSLSLSFGATWDGNFSMVPSMRVGVVHTVHRTLEVTTIVVGVVIALRVIVAVAEMNKNGSRPACSFAGPGDFSVHQGTRFGIGSSNRRKWRVGRTETIESRHSRDDRDPSWSQMAGVARTKQSELAGGTRIDIIGQLACHLAWRIRAYTGSSSNNVRPGGAESRHGHNGREWLGHRIGARTSREDRYIRASHVAPCLEDSSIIGLGE